MPYAFFGHSMGALISFELARYLYQYHHSYPVHLFVSARKAPQLFGHNRSVHDLPEPEFIEELRRLQGTPEEVLRTNDLLQLLLPVLRADFALCETYCYREEKPLVCPISAFSGLQDSDLSRNDLVAWSKQTQNVFTLHFLLGNHFFIHASRSDLLQALARDLIAYI
jgi:medium-chain acyl-[acyl-carrier-protein] hydrolase